MTEPTKPAAFPPVESQPAGGASAFGTPPAFGQAPAVSPAYGQAPATYGQAPASYGQVGAGTIGIVRNPWVQWIMMIIPIYNLVHLCSVAEQLKRFDSRNKGSGVASFFSYIPGTYLFFIPPIVLTVRTARRIRASQRAAGLQESCSTALSVVLLFVVGLNWWYWQSEMNRVWERYPGAVAGTQVPLYA